MCSPYLLYRPNGAGRIILEIGEMTGSEDSLYATACLECREGAMHKLIGEQERATIRTIALFQAAMDDDLARRRQPRCGASLTRRLRRPNNAGAALIVENFFVRPQGERQGEAATARACAALRHP
jgi:hypothetical protein